MCVLSEPEIKKRASDIFTSKSWHENCIQEATYDLRVDIKPLLRIDGKSYDKDNPYTRSYVKIEPGELAMLPTVESFRMPGDLVGSIKIKLSHSRMGLTPLFGPKIDPHFGRERNGERMYLWVSNLGLEPIHIEREDPVFTVEFHKLHGGDPPPKPKESAYRKFARQIHDMPPERNLGFTGRIEDHVAAQFNDNFTGYQRQLTGFESRLDGLERGNHQVVQFGIFLVASALLAGAMAAMFALVFSLNTESGLTTVDALEGSALGTMLFWVGISLSVAVGLLVLGALIQFTRSAWRGQDKSARSKQPSKSA